MDRFERRLLLAMGLAPLSLVGCEGPAVSTFWAGSDLVPELAPLGSLDEGGTVPAYLPNTAPPVLEARFDTVVARNHVAHLRVAVRPNDYVDVFLLSSDPGRETVHLGAVLAGSDGIARLRMLVPRAAIGPAQLEAQFDVQARGEAGLLRQILSVGISNARSAFPGLAELHPGMDPATILPTEQYSACVPVALFGDPCPLVADFHPWQALEAGAYSLDAPLPADVSLLACIENDGFPGECCYAVEAWDTRVGAAGACEENAGGGGGGGGNGWEDGRPFAVAEGHRASRPHNGDGWGQPEPVIAPLVDGDVKEKVVTAWLRTARAEHASVASFSRFNLELMALGAPSWLLSASTRALGDEIAHARLAYSIASTYAGTPIAPGPLDINGALARSIRPDEVLRGAILEGCINETVCALQVRQAASLATDPVIADHLATIAEDESRHAELSWAFVRWLLSENEALRPVAREAFAQFDIGPCPDADPDDAALAAHGVLSERRKYQIAMDVLARVVRPCATALLEA